MRASMVADDRRSEFDLSSGTHGAGWWLMISGLVNRDDLRAYARCSAVHRTSQDVA